MEAINIKSYKLRKSGNSTISTIPSKVKELLNVEDGDKVEFVVVGNEVHLQKAESVIDIDKSVQNAINQYHGMLDKLRDM